MNAQETSLWIARSKFNPNARLRLFCFPYAGGGASIFSSWSKKITADIEICPIELPGHETRISEPLFDRLEDLIHELACALLPYLDRPFAFLGHSMGGLLSFELAQLLRQSYCLSPTHLFISGRHAPQIPESKPPIHNLNQPEFIRELISLNGTPKAVLEDAELMKLFLPVLRADFTAIETYVYKAKPELNCPITVMGGLQDCEVSFEDLGAWQEQTSANCLIQMFPGDHFFISSSQSLVLEFLDKELQTIVGCVAKNK